MLMTLRIWDGGVQCVVRPGSEMLNYTSSSGRLGVSLDAVFAMLYRRTRSRTEERTMESNDLCVTRIIQFT